MRCRPADVTIFAWDHNNKSRIVSVIEGKKLNWYYCEDEFSIMIKRNNVEKLFSSIDNSFYKITIYYADDDADSIVITFKDSDLDKDCQYTITVHAAAVPGEILEAEELITPEYLARYPLSFTLTTKQFKKSMSDMGHYDQALAIEKVGPGDECPLQFTYAIINHSVVEKMRYNEVYRSSKKIQLTCSLSKHEAFQCRIDVADMKLLAGNVVTDDVRIYCHQSSDLIVKASMDKNAVVIYTLTRLA